MFRSQNRKRNVLNRRENQRTQHYRKMSLEIFPQSSANFPIVLEGHSKNISIGGTCVVLDAKDVNISTSVASFNKIIKNSMIKLSFPSQGLELKISGKIAWTHEVAFQGEKTLALGIQFQDLSPKLRGILFVFAESSKNS